MIIVIPFAGQSPYFDALADAFAEHGGLGSHRLIVVSDSTHLPAAEAFREKVSGMFMGSATEHVKSVSSTPVRLFRDGLIAATRTVFSVQEIHNPPVMWLEPGWIPSERDWATTASSLFFNMGGGGRVMANWRDRSSYTVGVGSNQRLVSGGVEPVGPAVFPIQYIRQSELVRSINNASPDWRQHLQYELIPLQMQCNQLKGYTTDSLVTIFIEKQAAPVKAKKSAEQAKPTADPAPEPTPEPTQDEQPAPATASLKSLRSTTPDA